MVGFIYMGGIPSELLLILTRVFHKGQVAATQMDKDRKGAEGAKAKGSVS